MIKIRNLPPRDFSTFKHFPGTVGNPFDVVLHSLEKWEHFSASIVLLLLAALTVLANLPRWLLSGTFHWQSLFLLVFLLSDWLLIGLLPRLHLSFGPTKTIVLILACLRALFWLLPLGIALTAEIIGTILILYGCTYEPFHLDIHTEVSVTPKRFAPPSLKVLHLGDLHVERWTRREEEIVRRARELQPDLILFSGDVLNLSYLHDPVAQQDARRFFRALSAPLGIYGVSGSPAVDLSELFPTLLADTSFQRLDNECVEIGHLCVWGLTCSHDPAQDEQRLQEMLSRHPLNSQRFNLLLHHSPDLAPLAARYGFDLQLAGHTHGGQVCLPGYGALFTGSLYGKTFESGHYQVNGMELYVTRGLGLEGAIAPRVRTFCRPEMIWWEL